jgi:hypothetical protein
MPAPGAAVLCVLAAAPVSSARAAFAIDGFTVAASKADGSADTLAGTHPAAFQAHIGFGPPEAAVRDLTLSLPPGFLVNPGALDECSATAFATPRTSPYEASASGESCPNSTQVGVISVQTGSGTRSFGLFNLVAPFGAAAAIGASPFGHPLVFGVHLGEPDSVSLELTDIAQSLDLKGLDLTIWGAPWQGSGAADHDPLRGNCLDEVSGGSHGECLAFGGAPAPEALIKTYLTLPTTPCGSPLVYGAAAKSWDGAAAQAAAATPGQSACNKALTTAKVQLMTDAAAARTGLAFNLSVNDGGGILNPGGVARPAIRRAILTLPEGLTINPSLGAGLGACSAAEFARESAASEPGAGCPSDSKIGTVTLKGVLGLAETLQGAVYVASPADNPFGSLLALYVVARSPRRGLLVRSVGKLDPNPRSGRLVAGFEDLPRLLYTHFSLTLREGQRSTLVSPPTCGTYLAQMQTSSWAEPDAFATAASAFPISRGDGGPCPGPQLPFAPGLIAGSLNPSAGASTPFYLRMTRTDSEQEITSYSATFPPGLLASLSGVGECPDAAIAAAKGTSGASQQANPSCPASSKIGRTLAGYGVGGTLAYAPGDLYLAGPYHGAPLSVVAIDAALIGPFDLGTVVIRSAIRVDRRSAQAEIDAAGSDPIPHILAGIPLHLRDIRVYVDRPGFTRNPTSCDPSQVVSRLTGAGTDPFDPADDSTAIANEPFHLLNCTLLGFRPSLRIALRGSSRQGAFPSLRATYTPRSGDADLAAASVTLPDSLFLAQQHIATVCTRVQFAAGACPSGSVYGRARAVTPLLAEPLEGHVYLRSSRSAVPDLVADLRGHGIEIEVPARIDSSHAGIRANFESLPDAPVATFTMTLFGGRRGLLQNGEDACAGTHRANARLLAQSNATAVLHPRLRAKSPKRARGHRTGRHRARAGGADVVQQGGVRIALSGGISPAALPRSAPAPVSVEVGVRISTPDGSPPPELRGFEIAVNRAGRFDFAGLPTCPLARIQPATDRVALDACRSALVGEGTFAAGVAVPEQSPFPSQGRILAFNGLEHGHRVIYAHIYGTQPVPTSLTLPLRISPGSDRFGTVLRATLPDVSSDIAFVTAISLRLHRTYAYRGRRHSFLSASCPAPAGATIAAYTLLRAGFDFATPPDISDSLVRSCHVSSG